MATDDERPGDQHKNDNEDAATRAAALHEHAIVLREAGSFADGLVACREAVALFEAAEGPGSANLANALVELGRLLEVCDLLDEAGPPVDRALAILYPILSPMLEVSDGEADPSIVEELLRLTIRAEETRGSVWRCRGHLGEAEAACRRALALAEAHLPADDALIAETLNSLGVVHKFQGRYDDAEPLYRRALAIVNAAGAADDEATLLHNLGGLAHARGDFATGEPLARRSVELREAAHGADHPTTAADRAAWGALLEGLGRLDDAQRAYTEALAVFEARLGPRSLEAASALSALGAVHHARGDYEDAERAYRRSIDIREQTLGPDHFDLGLTLNNLAMLLVDHGSRSEALQLLMRARAIFTRGLGPDHPHVRAVVENIDAIADAG